MPKIPVPAIEVLHIIQRLSRGGATRAMLALLPHSTREPSGRGVRHRIVSLTAAEPAALRLAEAAGLPVESQPTPDALRRAMAEADIVFVNFWNNPELYALFETGGDGSRNDGAGLPPMRLALWCQVGGASAPQVITSELIEFADLTLSSCLFTLDLPVFRELSPEDASARTGLLHDTTDFGRVSHVQPQPHSGFNVGYLGSVDFTKMHPEYVALCAAVDIPGVRFPVYGSGNGFATLAKQAQSLGIADRFDLRGYVEDVGAALATMDVFGYPLCPDTYAATDLVLVEAMAMGVPPVILSHGGPQRTVRHGETGLVMHSTQEYVAAIEYLYHNPDERRRLARNGREFVRRVYDPARIAAEMNRYLDRMMDKPKRLRRFSPLHAALLPYAARFPGALRFIRSLGSHAQPFVASLTAETTAAQLAADHAILRSSVPLANEGTGGILAYRNYHPDDGYLRFWAGLALHGQGRFALAVAEFNQALKHGCDHWRVSWHLARAAHGAGAKALATQAVQRVIEAAPNFAPARHWLEQGDAPRFPGIHGDSANYGDDG